MKKMKKIDAITRCKGVIVDVLTRRAKRLERNVRQYLDNTKDAADETREKANNLILKMGSCSGTEDTSSLRRLLDDYGNLRREADRLDAHAKYIEELLEELNKEVEVEE